jgi:hypothetical protein
VSGGPEVAGDRRVSSGVEASFRPLDVIACDTCGRSFATHDGPGMLAVIKGPCPDCGGRFQLTETLPDTGLL